MGNERGGVCGFNEHRKQGPLTDANDQLRAPSEEEIGIPVAEAIGGKHRLRSGLGVEAFEEFARTANGQHLQSDFLETRLVESSRRKSRLPTENPRSQDQARVSHAFRVLRRDRHREEDRDRRGHYSHQTRREWRGGLGGALAGIQCPRS